jgi:hypothetical protein
MLAPPLASREATHRFKCRDLIRRMAAENGLWGAPRIHGELLKLGITISERTVSRCLGGRPITRSQSWRTFLANHFAGQISPVMFAEADAEDIVVKASDVSLHRAPSIDASCASIHGPTIVSGRSHQSSSLDMSLGQQHHRGRTETPKGSGRARRGTRPLQPASRRPHWLTFVCGEKCLRDRWQCRINSPQRARPVAVLSLDSKNNQVVTVVAGPTFRSVRDIWAS